VSALLIPLRDTIENTNVALVLVPLVVAVAASGLRWGTCDLRRVVSVVVLAALDLPLPDELAG